MSSTTPPLPAFLTKHLHVRPISWSTSSDLERIVECCEDPISLENVGDMGMHSAEDVHNFTAPMRLSRRTLEDARIRRESGKLPNAFKGDEVQLEGAAMWLVCLRADTDGTSTRFNEHRADGSYKVIPASASTASLTFVGQISIWESVPCPPHIGWVILGPHSNKGYATEAASAVFDYMRNVYGIEHIMAVTSTRNVRSWRVAQKVGLRRQEKTMRLKGSFTVPENEGREGEAGEKAVDEQQHESSGEGSGKGRVVMWLCEGMKDFAPEVEFALLGGDPSSEH